MEHLISSTKTYPRRHGDNEALLQSLRGQNEAREHVSELGWWPSILTHATMRYSGISKFTQSFLGTGLFSKC